MTLFSKQILTQLAANGQASREALAKGEAKPDHMPVVKIVSPYNGNVLLLTESDPDNPERLFGLLDLGFESPDMGSIERAELEVRVGRQRVGLERDSKFVAFCPISVYAHAAKAAKAIVEDKAPLVRAANELGGHLITPYKMPPEGHKARALMGDLAHVAEILNPANIKKLESFPLARRAAKSFFEENPVPAPSSRSSCVAMTGAGS